MKGIKNCPFCGSAGTTVNVKLPDREDLLAGIGCVNPRCIVGIDVNEKTVKILWASRSLQDAIDAWNKRV